MSLSIEIRVNGHPVAVLDAYNTGTLDGKGAHGYAGRLAQFTLDGETVTRKVRVTHNRADEIVALAAKLLAKAAKP